MHSSYLYICHTDFRTRFSTETPASRRSLELAYGLFSTSQETQAECFSTEHEDEPDQTQPLSMRMREIRLKLKVEIDKRSAALFAVCVSFWITPHGC